MAPLWLRLTGLGCPAKLVVAMDANTALSFPKKAVLLGAANQVTAVAVWLYCLVVPCCCRVVSLSCGSLWLLYGSTAFVAQTLPLPCGRLLRRLLSTSLLPLLSFS